MAFLWKFWNVKAHTNGAGQSDCHRFGQACSSRVVERNELNSHGSPTRNLCWKTIFTSQRILRLSSARFSKVVTMTLICHLLFWFPDSEQSPRLPGTLDTCSAFLTLSLLANQPSPIVWLLPQLRIPTMPCLLIEAVLTGSCLCFSIPERLHCHCDLA